MLTVKMRFAALFLAPAFLLYTVFVFLPILGTVYYSLTNWRLGRSVEFVWFRNYANLLFDAQYWHVAANSLTLIGAAVLVQVPVASVIAYALHWVAFGFRFYRSVLFLPVVIAAVAIGLIFTVFYNGDVGAANELLDLLGLGALKRSWLSDSTVVLWAVNTRGYAGVAVGLCHGDLSP